MIKRTKGILKSVYNRYMSWFVDLTSSNVAIRNWNCLDVLLSSLNPS